MNNLIQTRFSKAAEHYDANAVAQKAISDKLFALLTAQMNKEFRGEISGGNILEIGCGTGNLSKQLLSLSPNKLVLNDICKEYAPILAHKLGYNLTTPKQMTEIVFFCGNAQELFTNTSEANLPNFKLIASSSAIQWMPEPLQFMVNCKKLMTPNALLAISTFTPENMHQVNTVSGYGLNYHTLEEVREALAPHYKLLHLSTQEITLSFNHPADILRHIKLTGVNGIHSKRWTKKDLEYFTTQYTNQFIKADGTYPLTYKPLFILCRNA